MAQEDVDRVEEFRKCIECFLCQDVCHVLRDHRLRERYIGPRFFVRVASLELHPLDAGDRIGLVSDEGGIGLCNITKCCTEVCPEGIRITDNAIIPLKERVVDLKYDPVFLGLKIGRRKDRTPVGPAVSRSDVSPIKHPSPSQSVSTVVVAAPSSAST